MKEFIKDFPDIAKCIHIADDEPELEEVVTRYVAEHIEFLQEQEERYKQCETCDDVNFVKCEKVLFEPIIMWGRVYPSWNYCPKVKTIKELQKYNLVNVWDEYPLMDLANFQMRGGKNEHLKEIVDAFAKGHEKRFYFIQGEPGAGKTHFVVGLTKMLLRYKRPVAFIPLYDFFSAKPEDDEDTTYNDLVERLKEVDNLILDDLGAEQDSKWLKEKLFAVIDARIRKNKATVVVSNLSEETIKKRYGDRFLSRLNLFKKYTVERYDLRGEVEML